MKVEVKDGKMIITLDMKEPTPSGTGKTLCVAGTNGYVDAGVNVAGKPVKINVNAYIPVK